MFIQGKNYKSKGTCPIDRYAIRKLDSKLFTLYLRFNHLHPLVSDVFQARSNINFLGPFAHSIQDHVNQAVCPSATNAITVKYSNK